MDLEKLREHLVEQSPDILKRRGLLEQKGVLIEKAEAIVEEFRSFYDSVHPEKDENGHASYRTNVVEVSLGHQELTPIGKGHYLARLRGFGREDIMPDFNKSILEGKEPKGWTLYRNARGFTVSYHFLGDSFDKLVATELYGPGQFRNGQWVYWEDYLNAGRPESIGRYKFDEGLPLPLLGMRVAGSMRALRNMDKKFKETMPLISRAAADSHLNPNLVERAMKISAERLAS